MTTENSTRNIVIRFQCLPGSREAQIMDSAKSFYGSKLTSKAHLALVDLFEPLYVAMNGGTEQEVQDAIARSLHEIRDLHRQALNQCQNSGYSSSGPRTAIENTPVDPTPGINELNGRGWTLISQGGK
ncbi:MAG: hypothetical protein HC851_23285 [Acaryochloris sp. RU_4_1]|nr:hypothetical protein [Acaryochloris sp. RU_4_1]NJR56958.1 hypothetical protein [Acaryochloris sp. CRU_2_0]